VQTYLNAGVGVTDLEKLLNREESIQDGYAKGRTSARVFHTDMTGDSVPDILISSQTNFRYYPPHAQLLFFHCHDGQYKGGPILSLTGAILDSPTEVLEPEYGVWAIQDLNDNGVPEVVFSRVELIHGGSVRYVHILEWDGQQMAHLISHNSDDPRAGQAISFGDGDGRIADIDGNGTLELIIMNNLSCLRDIAQPDRIEVYAWDGRYFSLAYSEELMQPTCH